MTFLRVHPSLFTCFWSSLWALIWASEVYTWSMQHTLAPDGLTQNHLNGKKWRCEAVEGSMIANFKIDRRLWQWRPKTVKVFCLDSKPLIPVGKWISTEDSSHPSLLCGACPSEASSFLLWEWILKLARSQASKSSAQITSCTNLSVSPTYFWWLPELNHCIRQYTDIFANGQGGGYNKFRLPSLSGKLATCRLMLDNSSLLSWPSGS